MADKNHPKKRRKKGQGSIHKKENGTYIGRISVAGYDPYSCVGTSKKEVEKKLEEFRLQTLRQEVVSKRVMVSDYIENWLIHVKRPSLKPASYDRLESTFVNHIEKSAVGRSQLGNLTSMDIQKLINEKSRSLSYSSIKKIYELLNSCFSYAVISRDIDFNPVLAVTMPKQENIKKETKKMQIYTEDELNRIKATASIRYKTGNIRYRHAYLFVLLANTGMREGEALALTWENVDLENRLIRVCRNAAVIKNRDDDSGKKYDLVVTTVKTKTGNRTIPCNDQAMEALLWLKSYQEKHHIKTEFVDCNGSGGMLSPHTLPKLLAGVLKAADVPYKGIHSFRHTFASNLIKAGVDVKIVSQLLGHASVKITYDTYVHVGLEGAVSAVNKLNQTEK